MDFFQQQDQARRKTFQLVLLFGLALLMLIVLTNLVVIAAIWGMGAVDMSAEEGWLALFDWARFGKITALVSGVILCAIGYRFLQLREGGKVIAEAMGGERLLPNSRDPDERRVLNVVEEMAIASGMPVPPVYLLKHETGINAFAAGYTPADAVVGVTLGTLQQLNRDELQGVIAHEFSHILNGDMRLNLRIIGWLYGILFVGSIGSWLMVAGSHSSHSSSRRSGVVFTNSSRRSGGDARLFLVGAALAAIGWIGGLMGGLIRAAVSREREYLADASAVQFTRNPEGIGNALRVIGGHQRGGRVAASGADELQHLFFAESIYRMESLLSTHPPLRERIRRILPNSDQAFIARPVQRAPEEEKVTSSVNAAEVAAAAAATVGVLSAEGVATAAAPAPQATSPSDDQAMQELCREPFGAMALVYALLIASDEEVKQRQLEMIQQSGVAGLSLQVADLLPRAEPWLEQGGALPLLEQAVPALKTLSEPQYKVFKRTLLLLIRADQQVDLFEWSLYQMVRHYLDAEFAVERPSRPAYKRIEQVADAYQLALSMLAYHGHQESPAAQRAFAAGAKEAGLAQREIVPETECDLDRFVKAMHRLANSYPLLKPRLIKGMIRCAQDDHQITVAERELLTAIGAVLDCPLGMLETPP